jgi:hypothetical protein
LIDVPVGGTEAVVEEAAVPAPRAVDGRAAPPASSLARDVELLAGQLAGQRLPVSTGVCSRKNTPTGWPARLTSNAICCVNQSVLPMPVPAPNA